MKRRKIFAALVVTSALLCMGAIHNPPTLDYLTGLLDAIYLRLDCSNDPLTGELDLGYNSITNVDEYHGTNMVLYGGYYNAAKTYRLKWNGTDLEYQNAAGTKLAEITASGEANFYGVTATSWAPYFQWDSNHSNAEDHKMYYDYSTQRFRFTRQMGGTWTDVWTVSTNSAGATHGTHFTITNALDSAAHAWSLFNQSGEEVYWTGAGSLLWGTDGGGTIGASGANRPNTVYVKEDLRAGGDLVAGDQVYLGTAIIDVNGTDTKIDLGTTEDTMYLQAGGEVLINLVEAAQDKVEVGDGGDVDIYLKTAGGDVLIDGDDGEVHIPHNIAMADGKSIGTAGNALTFPGLVSVSGTMALYMDSPALTWNNWGTGEDDHRISSVDDVLLFEQNVGDAAWTTRVSINGSGNLNFTKGLIASSATAISASADDVDASASCTFLVNSSGGNIDIGGFTGGTAGQVIYIVHSTSGNNVTLEDDEGTGNQDIKTPDGNDLVMGGNESRTLVFNGTYWIVIGSE